MVLLTDFIVILTDFIVILTDLIVKWTDLIAIPTDLELTDLILTLITLHTGPKWKRLYSEVLIRSEVVGVAKVANN